MASISVICHYQPRHKQTTSSYCPCPENISKYNANKCAVMTMSRKKRRPTNPSPLLYGNTALPESTTYTHLGIVQSGAGRDPFNPDDMKQVIRGTYFALSSVLSNTCSVNPFTMANLYRTCVLPRALFACELWNKMFVPT